MKKSRVLKSMICMTLCAMMLLAGCQAAVPQQQADDAPDASATTDITSASPLPEPGAATARSDLNIAVVVFGSFGDNGFNDLSRAGLERAITELGIRGTAYESGGIDITRIEPLLLDLCEGGQYDAIFVMGAACREAAENANAQFPDQRFIIFDAMANFAQRDMPNVASVTFRQNEASFLGGVLAAYVTTSNMEYANADRTVGIVMTRDNTVINDFLVGFIEGNWYVDNDIRILSAYLDSAVDTAKAKELTMNMAAQGADIVFGVAALATLGVVHGSRERNIYAIGVDNDIAMQVMPSDEEAARLVLTSVLKNTDVAVFRAIEAMLDDINNVRWGAVESIGFVEGAVGLARNEIFYGLSEEIRETLERVEQDIISGDIVVSTSFGMATTEVAALREQASR
ncbi:MAG: BMP family ABC transporter substrate-binding protein [Oscillospiraceae bacterium]|nr:BMP family ABC transporter substrate-binding protein [Oscillospiraceae bacterium]